MGHSWFGVACGLLALIVPHVVRGGIVGDPSVPVAAAASAAEAPRIDGVLDDDVWTSAQVLGPFRQREPREGEPPGEATDVRVVFDSHAMYIAVVCHDRDPGAIVATQMARDADLSIDDRLVIVLDPFFDHRNGFFFEVNALGARTDGQISNNAERLSRDWDGIWNASARVAEAGWVVEIAIPLKTLRFAPGQTMWGLNVERLIKRTNETSRWAAARQDVWIGNLAEAGHLEVPAGLRQGRALDVRPYLLGGDENGDGQFDAGVDLFKNLTPNLNAAVSINTDFAETEVDARQVNLTRFPLFFPEKRAFFLEGAGVFDMAGLTTGNDLMPFFSRRIGLIEGDEVPITVGAKLIGRAADYNIGVLDVQTRNTDEHPSAGQNLLAARVSRNLFRQSWVGALVTNGNPTGAGGNTLLGIDARFATSSFRGSRNLSLDLFLLGTFDEASDSRDYALGFKLDYPNDLWDVALTWKHIGERFNPALGFVPRTGVRRTSLGASFRPRPGRWGIRQLYFELRPEYVTDLGNRVESWRVFTAPVNVRLESGERFEWNVIPEFDRLVEPFEIDDGVVIRPGSYQWTRQQIEASTASKRWWELDLEYSWGGFYDGTRRQIEGGIGLKPVRYLIVRLAAEHNDVELPAGGFTADVFSGRLSVNFTPDLSWANLVQYDTESREFGLQSRLAWILRPGNDVFVVFNRGWERLRGGRYVPSFDKASIKLQVTWRP